MISAEPRKMGLDIIVVTHVGDTIGEDGTHPQIRMARYKKEPFDIVTENETFFGAWDAIKINIGKSSIIEMPLSFDYTL